MIRRKVEEEKILDVNATMQGSLVFSEPVNLRISGKFEGSLDTKGSLVIGENAVVNADIVGENITIAGKVIGKIKATEKFKLTSTAEVNADVEAPNIIIESGAIFNGKINMFHEKMSLAEISEFLSIEEPRILEWVNSGKIPVKKDGEKLFFDKREVEEWLSKNQ